MKTILRSVLYLQVTALLLSTALAGSSARQQRLPFRGTVEALEAYDISGLPTMLVDTVGSGKATQLGRFSVTWEFTVNLLNGEGVGSARFVAANGDCLYTESIGLGVETDTLNINHVVEQHTISGGTGRFSGATGNFTLDRLVDLTTGETCGRFCGDIVIPKTRHNHRFPAR